MPWRQFHQSQRDRGALEIGKVGYVQAMVSPTRHSMDHTTL